MTTKAKVPQFRLRPVLYWLPLGFVAAQYFYTVKVISGRSMQPTLNPDWSSWRDVAVFNKFSVQTLRNYARGDVVAVISPEDPHRALVKRIVAVAGDVVKTLPPYPDAEVLVPQGHVWIEGDESFRTDDSNKFGPVPAALLESKLTFIIWPLNRFGPLWKPWFPTSGDNLTLLQKRCMEEAERDRRRKSRVRPSLQT